MMKQIDFLGIGAEIGQGLHGLSTSPEYARMFFRYLQGADVQVKDHGDHLPGSWQRKRFFDEESLDELSMAFYIRAYERIMSTFQSDHVQLNWGGDHSIGISTVGAFRSLFPTGNVLWIDAHADLNLPSVSQSGNLHGMPVSILLNLDNIKTRKFSWLKSELAVRNLIYLGLRDLDPFEREVIQDLGIRAYTITDIARMGINHVAAEVCALAMDHPLHISFDIDSVDPEYAASTGIMVPNGLRLGDLDVLSGSLSKCPIKSIDVVEVNPQIGSWGQVKQTYQTAFRFLRSVFNLEKGGIYGSLGSSNEGTQPFALESDPSV